MSPWRAALKILRLRRRARIVEGDDVLSEILDHPGPTDTLFDVLAACIAALAPGPRVAILGFAGGGIVAPLRGMGFTAPLTAVDLSLEGHRLFREISGVWVGRVDVVQADAAQWLLSSRKRYDLILEDLSVPASQESVKPVISLDTLPQLMQRRLRAGGIAVTNVLPVPGTAWTPLLEHLAAPFPQAQVLLLHQYVNRILLAGPLPSPRETGRKLRGALAHIGSIQTRMLSLRHLTGETQRASDRRRHMKQRRPPETAVARRRRAR